MTNKNFLIEFKEPVFHADMMEYLEVLSTRYRFLRVIYIGKSLHGKSIPAIKIGSGDKNIIYTAGFNGNEMMTSTVMLRFINEFCELMRTEQRVYNVGIDYIYKTRSVYVVPMMNPDSIELYRNGNVDNSMPDIRPVTGFANTISNIKLMNSFRLNGNYITCPDISAFRMQSLIKLYARMTGCKISPDQPCVLRYGDFPMFDISREHGEFFTTYMSMRELLFTAPILC